MKHYKSEKFYLYSFKKMPVFATIFCLCLLLAGFFSSPASAIPANDNLADATVVATFPFSETIDNTGGTLEGGEICSYDYSFWYEITPTVDSALRVMAVNNTANPTVFLFTGTTHPLTWADNDGDACSNLDNVGTTSENFVWGIKAGETYYIRIASSSEGVIDILIDTPALTPLTNDDLANATPLNDVLSEYIDISGASLETDENLCGGITRSIWYTVTPAADAILAVLEDGEHGDHALGLYTGSSFPQTEIYCSDSDNRGSDSEGYAKQLNGGTTYYIKAGSRGAVSGVFNIRMALMPLENFTNDNLADAIEVTADNFTETIDNTGGSTETNETLCSSGDGSTFWYAITPDNDSTVGINVAVLDKIINPSLAVYTGTVHPLTQVACQDNNNLFDGDQDQYGGGEMLTMDMTAGTTYYVQVASDSDGPIGVVFAGLEMDAPPAAAAASSSSGCFIATAAYGSYWEPHVMTLRKFRDSHLLTNKLGTQFVNAYYKYSPPMADYIAEHDSLRSVARIGLAPLVGFSLIAMNYGMMAALAVLFGVLTMIIGGTCLVVSKREAS